jgi:16S rRNA (cytidine1402-2'-O)-methyltransferase
MAGSLIVVATPIGNLEDFSKRAIETLQSVDLILCEDTRHSARLFSHYGIQKPTTSYVDNRTTYIREADCSGQRCGDAGDFGPRVCADQSGD